ncbi:MAG: amidase, partial [Acidobacteria bacterium]
MLDPDALDLWQVRRGLLDRRLTARAVTERALEAQRRHAGLRAFVGEDPPRALREAAAADALLARGEDPGPAAGVPWSAKDLYGVPGYRTHAGCPRPLPERFEQPGPLVERLLAHGAPCVGKTHTVQFAFGGLGTNPHWPTPVNPWDAEVERVPGGSSSGAGVSVVTGAARIALGTDTAGSVRIPAAWTGCVGLKTTAGRWPTAGIVPLSPTLDTAGVLARDVADVAFA